MDNRIKILKGIALTLLVCFATIPMYGQVTIGSLKVPEEFSLLELVSGDNKGLRLPHIATTEQRDAIFTNAAGFKTNPLALGLQIYNMQTKSVETWNGTDWVSAWQLTGNDGTTPGIHFIGTIDDKDLIFKRQGVQAGWLNVTNTAFGVAALPATTGGFYNIAVGDSALFTNSGNINTAIGHFALKNNTGGTGNTAVGSRALVNRVGGVYNTAVGTNAMANGTSGSSNTAVGYNAMVVNTGAGNTAVGFDALQTNTTAEYNTAVGGAALSQSTGASNTAVGSAAMEQNSTGINNVAFGAKSLQFNGAGNNNTALGNSAGSNIKGGSNNIVIGNDINTSVFDANNELNIGNVIYGVNMYNPSPKKGNIGIGTNNPLSTLEVNGAITTVPYNAGANLTIDFAMGNVVYSTATGNPAFVFTGLKNGGTYTLAWQSDQPGAATINITGFTPKIMSNPTKTASQNVVYSIVCIGAVAYVYPVVFN